MCRIPALLIVLLLFGVLSGCSGAGTGGPGDVPSGALAITMLYGSEKQAWIEAVVKTFNNQAIKSPSGKPIFVTATPSGSNESLTQILGGQAQPTIWSPASGVLIPLANDQWAKLTTVRRS